MPVDLREALRPGHTAVLIMEMQAGVIGEVAALPELAGEVAALDVIGHCARLVAAARQRQVRVVHCTAEFRGDGVGTPINTPLMTAMSRRPGHLQTGTAAARIVPELGPHEADLVVARSHGVSPFGGTALDMTLRNLGVTSIVAAGVSVNLGVLGLAIEAVNLGYRVVVATDAVCGFPRDYAESVMRYSMALVATRATVGEIVKAWD